MKKQATNNFLILSLVALFFTALKIKGGYPIPWVWVFSPIWVPSFLTFTLLVLALFFKK